MDLEQKFVAIFDFYGFNSQDLFFDLFCFWPFLFILKHILSLWLFFDVAVQKIYPSLITL